MSSTLQNISNGDSLTQKSDIEDMSDTVIIGRLLGPTAFSFALPSSPSSVAWASDIIRIITTCVTSLSDALYIHDVSTLMNHKDRWTWFCPAKSYCPLYEYHAILLKKTTMKPRQWHLLTCHCPLKVHHRKNKANKPT